MSGWLKWLRIRGPEKVLTGKVKGTYCRVGTLEAAAHSLIERRPDLDADDKRLRHIRVKDQVHELLKMVEDIRETASGGGKDTTP